jgi:hypothetical protein
MYQTTCRNIIGDHIISNAGVKKIKSRKILPRKQHLKAQIAGTFKIFTFQSSPQPISGVAKIHYNRRSTEDCNTNYGVFGVCFVRNCMYMVVGA